MKKPTRKITTFWGGIIKIDIGSPLFYRANRVEAPEKSIVDAFRVFGIPCFCKTTEGPLCRFGSNPVGLCSSGSRVACYTPETA